MFKQFLILFTLILILSSSIFADSYFTIVNSEPNSWQYESLDNSKLGNLFYSDSILYDFSGNHITTSSAVAEKIEFGYYFRNSNKTLDLKGVSFKTHFYPGLVFDVTSERSGFFNPEQYPIHFLGYTYYLYYFEYDKNTKQITLNLKKNGLPDLRLRSEQVSIGDAWVARIGVSDGNSQNKIILDSIGIEYTGTVSLHDRDLFNYPNDLIGIWFYANKVNSPELTVVYRFKEYNDRCNASTEHLYRGILSETQLNCLRYDNPSLGFFNLASDAARQVMSTRCTPSSTVFISEYSGCSAKESYYTAANCILHYSSQDYEINAVQGCLGKDYCEARGHLLQFQQNCLTNLYTTQTDENVQYILQQCNLGSVVERNANLGGCSSSQLSYEIAMCMKEYAPSLSSQINECMRSPYRTIFDDVSVINKYKYQISETNDNNNLTFDKNRNMSDVWNNANDMNFETRTELTESELTNFAIQVGKGAFNKEVLKTCAQEADTKTAKGNYSINKHDYIVVKCLEDKGYTEVVKKEIIKPVSPVKVLTPVSIKTINSKEIIADDIKITTKVGTLSVVNNELRINQGGVSKAIDSSAVKPISGNQKYDLVINEVDSETGTVQVDQVVVEKPKFSNLWGLLGTKKVVSSQTLTTQQLPVQNETTANVNTTAGWNVTPNYVLTVAK